MYTYLWNNDTFEYDLYLDGVILDSFKTKKGVEMYIKVMSDNKR